MAWTQTCDNTVALRVWLVCYSAIPWFLPHQNVHLSSGVQKWSRVQHFSGCTVPTNHLRDSLKCNSDSVGLGWNLGVSISITLPADSATAGLGPHLQEQLRQLSPPLLWESPVCMTGTFSSFRHQLWCPFSEKTSPASLAKMTHSHSVPLIHVFLFFFS